MNLFNQLILQFDIATNYRFDRLTVSYIVAECRRMAASAHALGFSSAGEYWTKLASDINNANKERE